MKIKFKVYHTYGLAYEEEFTLAELGLEWVSPDKVSRENEELYEYIRPQLIEWTKKHYNHSDAMPTWEIVKI